MTAAIYFSGNEALRHLFKMSRTGIYVGLQYISNQMFVYFRIIKYNKKMLFVRVSFVLLNCTINASYVFKCRLYDFPLYVRWPFWQWIWPIWLYFYITHAKTLWCNLIKKIRIFFLWFSFLTDKKILYKSSINSAKPHTYTCLEGMALDCLLYDKKKSHKPNYDCKACKSGQ